MRSLLGICLLFTSLLSAEIHVIYTSALIPRNFPARKGEYLRSFNALKNYGFDPWIIEATHIDHSFYNDISNRVLYPHQNKYMHNLGANELLSIRTCFPHFSFADEDVVVKLTGRYWLFQPTLFKIIRENPDYDVYIKKWFGNGWFEFTGCFAMKWKHFKKMFEAANPDSMNNDRIAIEEILAKYIIENNLHALVLEKLDVLARINGIDETHAY
ncbi:MAG TPA: hypothetical protein VLE89_04240 [Chlamydiales bacterium]|nr:hypothetical protein [Chlamydiales bacterium]